MRILLTYLITQLITNQDDTLLDYYIVYEILSLWEKEVRIKKHEILQQFEKAHFDNYRSRVEYSTDSLGIVVPTVSYRDVKSDRIIELVNRQFEKFDRKIESVVRTVLIDKDMHEVKNILVDNKLVNGFVSDLMRIYRTENTRMRSELVLNEIQLLESLGYSVESRWLHTLSNPNNVLSKGYTPRDDHLVMNGVVSSDGWFTLPSGKMTKAPGLFGDPSEDINCRCDIDLAIKK